MLTAGDAVSDSVGDAADCAAARDTADCAAVGDAVGDTAGHL